MTKNERYKIYKDSMEEYTFLTILYLLDIYMGEEDYIECAILKKVIDDYNIRNHTDIPTIYDDYAVDYFYRVIIEEWGEIAADLLFDNIPTYADKLIKRTNK